MGVRGPAWTFLSEARLIEAVRAGDEDAFARVYDRYASELLAYCRHMLGSQADAEDAVQQTFLNAHRALQESRSPITLRPWLYTIARNQCIGAMRQRPKLFIDPAAPVQTVGLSRQVEERQELRSMLADIAKLPSEQREALLLSGAAMSGKEVAAVLGTDPKRVKAMVYRARRSLADSRDAREADCDEIRELLSILRGGSLRRTVIRRHLLECDGCRDYRLEVRRQRQLVAILVAVPLPVALKALCVPGAAVAAKAAAGSAGTAAVLAGKAASTGGALASAKLSAAAVGVIAVAAIGGPSAARDVAGGSERSAADPRAGAEDRTHREAAITAPAPSAPNGALPSEQAGSVASDSEPIDRSPGPVAASETNGDASAAPGAAGTIAPVAPATEEGGPAPAAEEAGALSPGGNGPPVDAGPQATGPPGQADGTGPPAHAGPPGGSGPPGQTKPDAVNVQPAETGPPEWAGAPVDAGPKK